MNASRRGDYRRQEGATLIEGHVALAICGPSSVFGSNARVSRKRQRDFDYFVTVLLHFEHFSGAFERFTDATTHSTARRSNLCKKLRATWRPRFVAATPRHTRRSTVARDGGLCFREMMVFLILLSHSGKH